MDYQTACALIILIPFALFVVFTIAQMIIHASKD